MSMNTTHKAAFLVLCVLGAAIVMLSACIANSTPVAPLPTPPIVSSAMPTPNVSQPTQIVSSGGLDVFQVIDLSIKFIALFGGFAAAYYGYRTLRHTLRRARHQYFHDLDHEFLNPQFLKTRKEISHFWINRVCRDPGKCIDLNIKDISDIKESKQIITYLKQHAGVTVSTLTDAEFSAISPDIIHKTEEILNKYEYFGKLWRADLITAQDIRLLFYTALADIFVVTLPFILYRRGKKSMYAQNIQLLLSIATDLSGDLTSV